MWTVYVMKLQTAHNKTTCMLYLQKHIAKPYTGFEIQSDNICKPAFRLQLSLKEHSPGAHTSKGISSSPHQTSWTGRQNRWGCVCGGRIAWHNGAYSHTSGRSSLRSCEGSLSEECQCTGSPCSAQYGQSPLPLLPEPSAVRYSSEGTWQLPRIKQSLSWSVSLYLTTSALLKTFLSHL